MKKKVFPKSDDDVPHRHCRIASKDGTIKFEGDMLSAALFISQHSEDGDLIYWNSIDFERMMKVVAIFAQDDENEDDGQSSVH